MNYLLYIAFFCFSSSLLSQQLDIDSQTGNPLEIWGASPLKITFNELGFPRGYFGSIAGNIEDVDFGTMDNPTGSVHLSPATTPKLTINASGMVGLGTVQPADRLTLNSGDIRLLHAPKGVMLDASNRPIITRGWGAFTSGPYQGIGRWGLFLHSNRLTFGVPNRDNKGFQFARYNLDSSRDILLNIDVEGGMSRPAQGNIDLLPVAMGLVDGFDGSIIGGTGNFSVQKLNTGIYLVTINNITYNKDSDILSATTKHIYNSAVTYLSAAQAPNGAIQISTFSSNGAYFDQGFQFILYRPN